MMKTSGSRAVVVVHLAVATLALWSIDPWASVEAQPGPVGPNDPPPTRSMDGSANNLDNPSWGSADRDFLRLLPPAYEDGILALAGASRPNPRDISNVLSAQATSVPSERGLSGMVWQWGQFLDHDIAKTPSGSSSDSAPIGIPFGDEYFDPMASGMAMMGFTRSLYNTTEDGQVPRQQINTITAWIDGSNVYGSNDDLGSALRAGTNGRLKTSGDNGEFLPLTVDVYPNNTFNPSELYLAGDDRANEQLGLTALHTVFVREHNRLAELFFQANPSLSDDQIYQRARQVVGAEMQCITYGEFLPALLGEGAVPPYSGYEPSVDGTLANEFAAAAFRLGHSMLNSQIAIATCLTNESLVASSGMGLRDIFFQPEMLPGMDAGPILAGLATQKMEEIDIMVIDDVRNFLFGEPGDDGLDLVSLNIQRGRDHGLGSLSELRSLLGLPPATNFTEFTGDSMFGALLEDLYGTIENADLWVALLVEKNVAGSSVGETLKAALLHQFEALRSGDRFFYLNDPTLISNLAEIGMTVQDLEAFSLGDIIKTNTGMECIQDNVFFATCTSLTTQCTGVRPLGDLNSDGIVSAIDLVIIINKVVFDSEPTPPEELIFFDVDGGSSIDGKDILEMINVVLNV